MSLVAHKQPKSVDNPEQHLMRPRLFGRLVLALDRRIEKSIRRRGASRALVRLGIGIAISSVLFAAGMNLLAGPRYIATTYIEPPERQVSRQAAPTSVDDTVFIDATRQLLESHALARAVAKKLRLDESARKPSLAFRLMNSFSLRNMRPATQLDLAARELAQTLRISTARKSYYVEVSYPASDPERAALVANAVASEFILLNKRSQLARRCSQLEVQLQELASKYSPNHPRLQATQIEVERAQSELKQISAPNAAIMSPEALVETGLVIPAIAVSIPANLDLVSTIAFGVLLSFILIAVVLCFFPTTRNLVLRTLQNNV